MSAAYAIPSAAAPCLRQPTAVTPRRLPTQLPRRRAPSRRARPAAHASRTPLGSGEPGNTPPQSRSPDAHEAESYLQCVECSAVYLVEPEELEGAPRVVGCSACLHEWYASEADLLWGADESLVALSEDTSFEARSRRTKEAARKAFAAAQGVDASSTTTRPDLTVDSEEEPDVNLEEELPQIDTGTSEESDAPQKARTVPAADVEDKPGVIGRKGQERRVQSKFRVSPEDANARGPGNAVPEGKVQGRAGTASDTRFNVFVGNLSFRAMEEDLYRAFSGYGAVLKCQVPADPSGASRGYGFVEMSSRESGLRAIESLQGTSILGRDVSLNEARPRRDFAPGFTRRQGPKGGAGAKEARKTRASDVGAEGRTFGGVRREENQREYYQDRVRNRKSKEVAS